MDAGSICRDEPLLRLAGALWLLAGVMYLACESIAAAAFPGYSYARNYISDLGVPYDGLINGRGAIRTHARCRRAVDCSDTDERGRVGKTGDAAGAYGADAR